MFYSYLCLFVACLSARLLNMLRTDFEFLTKMFRNIGHGPMRLWWRSGRNNDPDAELNRGLCSPSASGLHEQRLLLALVITKLQIYCEDIGERILKISQYLRHLW